MCDGSGSLRRPDHGLHLRFGEPPSRFSQGEVSLILAYASKLEELAAKFGVDPGAVKVSFEFGGTGRSMSFTVSA